MFKNIQVPVNPGFKPFPPLNDGNHGPASKNSGPESSPPLNDDFSMEVVSLLKSQPGCSVSLDQFGECYRQHFGKTFNVEKHGHTKLKTLLEELPNIVNVTRTGTCSLVMLKPFPPLNDGNHGAASENPGPESSPPLNDYFSMELVSLLKSQPGYNCLSLAQFGPCYKQHFGKTFNVKEHGHTKLKSLFEALPDIVSVTQIGPHSTVTLKPKYATASNPVKVFVDSKRAKAAVSKGTNAVVSKKEQTERLASLSVELTALLKSQPECSIPFGHLSGEYQHHFKKVWNFDEYGFSGLKSLIGAMPQTVQIVGSGPAAYVKLTKFGNVINPTQPSHNSVMQKPNNVTAKAERRKKVRAVFSKELTELLKSRPDQSISQSGIIRGAQADAMQRKEGLLVLSKDLTKLLKSRPGQSMSINEFMAIYHIHFGEDCKFEEYGYTMGIQWVHEIQEMLQTQNMQLEGFGSEARITLSENNSDAKKPPDNDKIRQFANECIELLTLAPECTIPFGNFFGMYSKHFGGRQIKLADYGFKKQIDLLKAISDTVEVAEVGNADRPVKLIVPPQSKPPGNDTIRQVVKECSDLLIQAPECTIPFDKFATTFQKEHLNIFSMELVELLKSKNKIPIMIPMVYFQTFYEQHFKKKFNVKDYGYSKLKSLFRSLPHIVQIVEMEDPCNPCITLAHAYAQESDEVQYKDERAQQFAQECTDIFGKEERKQEFAQECVELLMDMPDQRIPLKSFQDKYKQHFGRLCRSPSDYRFNSKGTLSISDLLELFEAMPDTVKVTGSEQCARSCACRTIELTQSTLHSNFELPQNDMPEPVDVMDVEDEEAVKETDPKESDKEDKGDVKRASVKPLGSLSEGIKRMFGFITWKQ